MTTIDAATLSAFANRWATPALEHLARWENLRARLVRVDATQVSPSTCRAGLREVVHQGLQARSALRLSIDHLRLVVERPECPVKVDADALDVLAALSAGLDGWEASPAAALAEDLDRARTVLEDVKTSTADWTETMKAQNLAALAAAAG